MPKSANHPRERCVVCRRQSVEKAWQELRCAKMIDWPGLGVGGNPCLECPEPCSSVLTTPANVKRDRTDLMGDIEGRQEGVQTCGEIHSRAMMFPQVPREALRIPASP